MVEDTKKLMVGVVTERDVCYGVAADDRRASEVRVEEIMRPASVCCGVDESVEEAHRNSTSITLPVVDKAGAAAAPSASLLGEVVA